MGILSGRATYQSFYVLGEPPAGFHETYAEMIRRNQFVPIDKYAEADQSVGWVLADDILESEPIWDRVLVSGEYLTLALRVDALRVPAPILKATLKRAYEDYKRENNREHLSKLLKMEIKDRVMIDFRRKILPNIKAYDWVWNLRDGKVYFSGTSSKMIDTFIELFEATFDIRLASHAPYTALLYGGFAQDIPEKVLQLEPTTHVHQYDAPGAVGATQPQPKTDNDAQPSV